MENTPSFLGYFYAQQSDWPNALEQYHKAIEINPHFFWNYYNLALVCHRTGRYRESNEFAQMALQKKPDIAMLVVNKSPEFRQVWRYIGDMETVAMRNLKAGFEDSFILMAANYYHMKSYDQALGLISTAAPSNHRRELDRLLYAGLSAYGLGRYEMSVMFLQELVKQDPRYAAGWRAMALSLEALGKNDIARQAYLKAGSESEENPQEPVLEIPLRLF